MNRNYKENDIEMLVSLYQRDYSQEIFEAVMKACEGLVIKVAQKYHETIPSLDLEDLVSEGNIILWDAVKTYEPGKGCKFTTFLYSCLSRNYNNLYRFENAEKRRPGGFIRSVEQMENGTEYEGNEERSSGSEELAAECIEYNMVELRAALKTIAFSDREHEVIRYLMDGKSKPEIADLIGVKTPTIHSYVKRIGSKLIESGIVA